MSANCQRKENHFVKTKHAKACMLMASATGRYRRIQQPEYWSIIITNNNTIAGGQFRSALVRNWASSSTASVHLTQGLTIFLFSIKDLLNFSSWILLAYTDQVTRRQQIIQPDIIHNLAVMKSLVITIVIWGTFIFVVVFDPFYHKFSMLSKLYSPVFTSVQLISAFSCFGSLCFCIH